MSQPQTNPTAPAPALPDRIPLFPLPRALLLPRAQLPLTIFEPRYLRMVEDALKNQRIIGMIQPHIQKTPPKEGAPPKQSGATELYRVGCAGKITSFTEIATDRMMIVLTGIGRFRLQGVMELRVPYLVGEINTSSFAADHDKADESGVARKALLNVLKRYLQQNKLSADWKAIERTSDEMLVNSLSVLAPFGVAEKQALLEAPSLAERCQRLIALTEIALAGDGQETVQ